MSDIVKQAAEYWPYIAWLLKRPESEAECELLVQSREELVAMIGTEKRHSLASLVAIMDDHIEAYNGERWSMKSEFSVV
ncbi:hypothetical protein ACIOYV_22610 [Pseudomonas sp. NPDC087342]|uniref:hypothetical protein n=1 Tax=Pseudomonas sp. NPDC087342 TaxID=3364437 RepID=UPI0037F752E7